MVQNIHNDVQVAIEDIHFDQSSYPDQIINTVKDKIKNYPEIIKQYTYCYLKETGFTIFSNVEFNSGKSCLFQWNTHIQGI